MEWNVKSGKRAYGHFFFFEHCVEDALFLTVGGIHSNYLFIYTIGFSKQFVRQVGQWQKKNNTDAFNVFISRALFQCAFIVWRVKADKKSVYCEHLKD